MQKRPKTKKVKTTSKSNSKIIPFVTVIAKKTATVPVMNSVLRTVAVDYSKQSGGAGKVNLVGLKYQFINDLIKTAGAIIGTRAAA